MLIQHTDIIEAPCELVYSLVKDKLPKIVPYLPSIKKIEKKNEEKLANGQTKIINHWYAQLEVPGLLTKVLSEDFFSWKDVAVWNDEGHFVTYQLESFFANELFLAKGKNEFKAKSPKQTELKLSCDIQIFADKIPGVPRILASKVTPAIEKLVEKMLAPNMSSLGSGIKAYLAKQG